MSTTELHTLLAEAIAWADVDPDATTQGELRALVEQVRSDDTAAASGAEQELRDRFSGPLVFGTAGLRAALGAGPNRMNRVVVRRAAAGVAAHALELAASTYSPRAVVGFDARHNSRIFAEETAAILTAAGIETFLMPRELPTPVLAYAIRSLECEVGIMVTASHNPPQDNGYKVYLGGRAVEEAARGVQIVAPHDAGIAAHIARVTASGDVELAASGWTVLPDSIESDYTTAIAALSDPAITERDLRIVLTPLHGVGGRTALAVLAEAGFDDVTVVERQAEPDPDFPTVAFPNPEEPGALDLALETAAQVGADLVIANDPDADRVALAAVEPSTGQWRMLRGDEVGTLLGLHLAARGTASAEAGNRTSGVFANSIVSSRLLGRIAAVNGVEHARTLTGFKWIARVPHLSYGYEEALGYCVAPEIVRDKDGISAGLLLAELAAATKAAGRTLFDLLDDASLVHGLHASDQLSVRVSSLGLLGAMMNRLRENPPTSFADSPVTVAEDLALGSAHLPPTDGLLYLTQDQTRVIIRPSGTEPKLKCYLEVVEPVGSAAELDTAKDAARHRLDAVKRDIGEALGL